MNAATTTPASVACTPDFRVATHMIAPTRMYGLFDNVLRRFNCSSTAIQAAATASAGIEILLV